jgi:uncharacterized protein involved in exopolysaccharide biosynthesis
MELAMRADFHDHESRSGRDEIDLGGVAAALARRRRLILGATAGCAAAALVFCLVVKPRYIAEARVIVEDQETYYTRVDPSSAARDAAPPIDAEAVNSQIQLVSSRDIARKVVAALRLQTYREFDPSAHGLFGALSLLSGRDGADVAEDRLLNAFFDHLTVMSPAKSRILQIEFSSRDPDLAAKAANTVAEQYIAFKQQAKREDARQAAQSLQPLIADLQQRATEADAKVSAFRVANGLFESSENRSLPTQQLGEIASKLADARAALSDSSARAKALRDLLAHGRLGDAAEIASNDLVRAIAARRSALEAERAGALQTLLPGHPKVRELDAQMSDIERQLRAAVEKAARGLENNARVAAARVVNLTQLLDEQKKTVGVANGEEAKLRELQRQAKTLKDQLESESAKYQAALARENAENAPADARLVSRALAPSIPAFPKKVPITLFGALAGLFFSSFYVIAREMGGSAPAPAPAAAPDIAPVFGRRRSKPARVFAQKADAIFAEEAEAGFAQKADAGFTQEADAGLARGVPESGASARIEPGPEDAPPKRPLRAASAASRKPAPDAPGAMRQPLVWLKRALADFAAPAVRLDKTPAPAAQRDATPAPAPAVRPDNTPAPAPAAQRDATPAPAPAVRPDNTPGPAPAAQRDDTPAPGLSDIWVRDPFAVEAGAADPEPETGFPSDPEPPAPPEGPGERPRDDAPESSDLAAHLGAAGDGRGVTALLAEAGGAASPSHALIAARALSREGRAILIEAGPDPRLAAALAEADAAERPGLAQLLAGEASYAEAIARDARSRLHLLGGGGPLDIEAEDLSAVIEVLRATYDFVLLAVRADALGLDLAREADAVAVLGPASLRRDHLHDDFAGAGARKLILASLDDSGRLSAGAA